MTNRLADETSPYLRQHADNPVEWYPWGQQAFDAARAADRPIMLSIGYSACHWCHVMAHESFENEDTAAVMNRLFVNVKVDREERPDVDAIYMEVVTALTGRGGWPMTVFLTPDGEAFYGGTYFPPTRRGGMPSFLDVCAAIDDAWTNRRDEVSEQATHITEALAEASATEAGDLPSADTFNAALTQMHQQYDERWGGFGTAPKFPQAMALELLLRRPGPPGGHLPLVTNCLDAMASGGIYDHLGGGFARYSVDEEWLVPHFEKMLYDNALLSRVYLHAWQLTGEERFRQVLDETIGYVLRDLTHPGGGFYSAEDADSEGEEGKFYVWTEAQIRAVLGNGPDTDAALAWWGVDQGPNFEHGTNILHRPVRGDLVRPGNVEAARIGLLAAREARVRPGLDDKVLTEWNALFLASLAEAARVTGDAAWTAAAVRNGAFLLDHLRRDDGRWLRSWQADGGARHLAYAVDYGALLDAFVRLAELTGEARWIAEARAVADGLISLFWDDEHGGVFTTGSDADALITRPKDVSDNATPSANALAAFGLLRLSALTGDDDLRGRAESILRLLTPLASRNALFFAHGLAAADLWRGGSTEIVVTGDRPDLVAEINRRYLPRAVLAWGEPYDSPLWADRADDRAYVCEGFTCKLPATTAEELAAQLG